MLAEAKIRWEKWTTDRPFEQGHLLTRIVTRLAYYTGINSPSDNSAWEEETMTQVRVNDDGTIVYWHPKLGRFFRAEPDGSQS